MRPEFRAFCFSLSPADGERAGVRGFTRLTYPDSTHAKSPADPAARFLNGVLALEAESKDCGARIPVLAATADSKSVSLEFPLSGENRRAWHHVSGGQDGRDQNHLFRRLASLRHNRSPDSTHRKDVGGEICNLQIGGHAADARALFLTRIVSSGGSERAGCASWRKLIIGYALVDKSKYSMPPLTPPSPRPTGRGKLTIASPTTRAVSSGRDDGVRAVLPESASFVETSDQ